MWKISKPCVVCTQMCDRMCSCCYDTMHDECMERIGHPIESNDQGVLLAEPEPNFDLYCYEELIPLKEELWDVV